MAYEDRLFRKIEVTYCYAGGFHGPRERSIVAGCAQLAGAVSTAPGVNGREADRASLRRTMIVGNERPAEFRAIIAGACDAPSWVARTRRALARSERRDAGSGPRTRTRWGGGRSASAIWRSRKR